MISFYDVTLHAYIPSHDTVLSWHLPWLSFTFWLHFPSTSLKWTGGVNIQDLGKMLLWQSFTGEGRTFDYVRVPQHWSDCWPALKLPCWRWLVVLRLVSVITKYLMGQKSSHIDAMKEKLANLDAINKAIPVQTYYWMVFALGISRNLYVCGRYTELSTGHSPLRINIASKCYTYFDRACHSHSMVGSWKITYLGFSDAFSRTYFYAQTCRYIWFMCCFFHVSSKVPIPPI